MSETYWFMLERDFNNNNKLITLESAKNRTERSPKSKLNQIKTKLNSAKSNEAKKLNDLVNKREYRQFQKEIWINTKKWLDWKLWGISLKYLENYLSKIDQTETSKKDFNQELEDLWYSIRNPKQDVTDTRQSDWNTAKDWTNIPTHIDWNDSKDLVDNIPTRNNEVTLASLRNGSQSAKEWIFHEWPKLWALWSKLQFDWTSKINFVKPHLDELNQLSTQILSKINNTVKYICISDKTITNWSTNEDLLWVTPRWYTNGMDYSYVWGCYRDWVVYAWRGMSLDWSYYDYKTTYGREKACDSQILHEIWHAFDDKYHLSTSTEFQNFHKSFYEKIWTYFQQGWPWWAAWCSEFFAEASAEFYKWWKESFTKYYSQDFYDYMEKILC